MGLMNIGEEAKPPFAVLPDPCVAVPQSRRSGLRRWRQAMSSSPISTFLAALDAAQHDVPGRPAGRRAAVVRAHRAGARARHAAAARARCRARRGDRQLTVDRAAARPARTDEPAAGDALAVQRCAAAPPDAAARDGRGGAGRCRTAGRYGPARARRGRPAGAFRAAGARLLAADDLKPVADGVCPACGGAPVTSSVVGWPKAHNTRFCTCSLCATHVECGARQMRAVRLDRGHQLPVDRGQAGHGQGRDLRQLPRAT